MNQKQATLITRETLVRVVKQAAARAMITPRWTAKLVEVVSDPSTKLVCRGGFWAKYEGQVVQCPAALAGGDGRFPGDAEFACEFDDITRALVPLPTLTTRVSRHILEVTDA